MFENYVIHLNETLKFIHYFHSVLKLTTMNIRRNDISLWIRISRLKTSVAHAKVIANVFMP